MSSRKPKPPEVTPEEVLRHRVHQLELRLEAAEARIEWLRKRLSSILPERHYCPFCNAVIHKAATACGACGRSWGQTKDPKEGLPL